jgi:hypothetical protein
MVERAHRQHRDRRVSDGLLAAGQIDLLAVVRVPALLSIATVAGLLDCHPRTA